MIPARPASATSAATLRTDSSVCWTTPGIEEIGRGSVRPSATNTGRISCRGSTAVSATIARITGLTRSRRGRTSWFSSGTDIHHVR